MQKNIENNKTVLLGVTGCIAAYKACEILRLLQKKGYSVKVVMTTNATKFVGPNTFSALSNNPVSLDLFDDPSSFAGHISLAKECDLFLIAPCTANVIAKISCGVADDFLTTTALAFNKQIVIAPAMHNAMYENCATQDNIQTLKNRGVIIVEPEEGHLACGDEGKGRLADPEYIVDICSSYLDDRFTHKKNLLGYNVLITAGPTREKLDPVRYISNLSSGKMGYALAFEALCRGAKVCLISGPVNIDAPKGASVVNVESASEMYDATMKNLDNYQIVICSAAVCDYMSTNISDHKIKKHATSNEETLNIELVETPDILGAIGANKNKDQYIVGFAAETNDVIKNAQEKLRSKNVDMIIANNVENGKVFGSDYNEASIITFDGIKDLDYMPKTKLAKEILDEIVRRIS